MFCQRRFGEEMARSVSSQDTQRFRWVTIAFLAVSSLAVIVAAYLCLPHSPFMSDLATEAYEAIWPAAIGYLVFILFLIAATGLPSYFFHPREVPVIQQNRAVALSYYACGPLSFLGVACLSLVIAVLPVIGDYKLSFFFTLTAVVLPVGAVVPWWLDLIHLCRRLLPQRPARAVAVAIIVPVLWVSLGVALFLVVPLTVLFVVIVIHSFP